MGTHPIFESDFDCLTDRQDGRSLQYFLPNGASAVQVRWYWTCRHHQMRWEIATIFSPKWSICSPSTLVLDMQTPPNGNGWLMLTGIHMPVTLAIQMCFPTLL